MKTEFVDKIFIASSLLLGAAVVVFWFGGLFVNWHVRTVCFSMIGFFVQWVLCFMFAISHYQNQKNKMII